MKTNFTSTLFLITEIVRGKHLNCPTRNMSKSRNRSTHSMHMVNDCGMTVDCRFVLMVIFRLKREKLIIALIRVTLYRQ